MSDEQHTSPAQARLEAELRETLALMRVARLDFRLRVKAGELLVRLGETQAGFRVLRSCANYFTLAGFPVEAVWTLKVQARNGVDRAQLDRSLELLARHYSSNEARQWGAPIFETPQPKRSSIDAPEHPADLSEIFAEVERRGSDIVRGVSFPDELPRCPILSDLDPEAFVTVARRMRLREVAPDTVLMTEGEPGQAVYVVISGQVEVTKTQEGGDRRPLARLSEGAIFGEMALVTESPRVAQVRAIVPTVLLELDRGVLEELGAGANALRAALCRQVGDRMMANLVKLSPVFADVSPDRQPDVLRRFESKLAERDEVLIAEGEAGPGLFMILDGIVQVIVRKGSEVHELAWLREGDIFGEISLDREVPATATCVARRRTLLMFLKPQQFQDMAQEFPEVRERIHLLGDYRLVVNFYALTA